MAENLIPVDSPTTVPKSNDDKPILSEDVRVGLKAEIASPFRKVRQFFYAAFGIAGGLGLFTGAPQLLFAFQGGENSPDLGSTVINMAVNLGGVVGSILLWDRESIEEKKQLERYAKKERGAA